MPQYHDFLRFHEQRQANTGDNLLISLTLVHFCVERNIL